MDRAQFDAEGFYAALDAQRAARKLLWKKVAEESGVSASTLTRLAQGKRPDVDSLAALLTWAGLSADPFVLSEDCDRREVEPLAQIVTYLRADKKLSPEGAAAMEAVIRATYEKLRRE